jgi:hypothetical protein
MSKEYIEREAAVGAVEYIACRNSRVFSSGAKYGEIMQAIQEVHAADVAPVIHGKWIHKNGEMYCSVCGSEALMDEVYYKSSYCPDCGVKMDGGK